MPTEATNTSTAAGYLAAFRLIMYDRDGRPQYNIEGGVAVGEGVQVEGSGGNGGDGETGSGGDAPASQQ